jgi:predicted ArsR family transcriptional regulator
MNFLETHNKATAVELSQMFDMTQANIRHHLATLVNEGKVEVVGQNQPTGRGRPTLLYMPTRQVQKHSLDNLVSILLDEIRSIRSIRQRKNRIKRLADRLAANGKTENKSITIRLGESMQHLNDLHYQAHWEARANTPLIILGKCPYAPIIDQYPELCIMDKYMLETMLDNNVEQITKIERLPDGPQQCLFALKPVEEG